MTRSATAGGAGPVSTVTTWLNHHSALHADWDALGDTDAIGIDGTFLQILLKARGCGIRRTSADLTLPAMLERRRASGATIAFVGGEPGVANRAADRVPGVVATFDGFDDVADPARLADRIRDCGASVVVLGLGAPLQDRLATRLRDDLDGVELFTAGGWLDQLARSQLHSPAWIHALRLGWVWRMVHEPRRLGYRYTVEPFIALAKLRTLDRRFARMHMALDESGTWFVPADGSVGVSGRSILQVVTQLERAGAQTLAAWLERELDARGADVTTRFLYDKSGSDLFDPDRCLMPTRPGSPRAVLTLLTALRGQLRGRDLVIAHTHYSIAAVLLAVATLLPGRRPRVVAVHHWPIDRYPHVARALYRIGRALSGIDQEVFVSDAVRPEPTRGVVVENPIPGGARTTEEAAGPTPGDSPDLLIVARHSVEKSIHTAIEALVSLPGRTLTLVGTGPITVELYERATYLGVVDRVHFAGTVENTRVRTMMANANALVLPSAWEAMPMVLLEGVAAGAPIVVSDIPAHRFVFGADAGIAFTTGDPESLAAAIGSLREPGVRDRLSRGAAHLGSRLSEAECGRRWQDVLGGTLESR